MKIRVFSIVLTVIMFLTQIGGNCLTVSATEESGIGTEIGALTDMDYNVWFENLRDEYHTWFYTNEEEPKLSLNVDNLDGCEYEVEWTVGIKDDNGEFLDTIESVDDAYEVTVSGCDLIFKPDELRAALEVNEDENFWCTVRAVVYVDETEVASAETGVEIRIPTYTYFFPVEDDLCQLPYWDYGIDKNMGCWVNDVLYPEGADIGTEITNVEVSNDLADEDESPVVTVEPYEDGNGWNLHMERMGLLISFSTVVGKMEPKLLTFGWERMFILWIL